MGRRDCVKIEIGSIVVAVMLLHGCVSNEQRDARLVAEQPECASGEILQCHASGTGRISDGRFGRRGQASQLCSCEPASNIERIRGADLPSEPR